MTMHHPVIPPVIFISIFYIILNIIIIILNIIIIILFSQCAFKNFTSFALDAPPPSWFFLFFILFFYLCVSLWTSPLFLLLFLLFLKAKKNITMTASLSYIFFNSFQIPFVEIFFFPFIYINFVFSTPVLILFLQQVDLFIFN